MGGKSGGTTVQNVQAPAAPTAGQSAAEYAAALPSILEANLKYQPQFNEADYASFAKLAPLYTQVYDQINKQYYPQTYGLQEQLAKQASEASSATNIPEYMRKQYADTVNAQLGTNAYSPIGADYLSRGLINQGEQYRQYYQNLGLSLAGRQPLTQTQYQQPSFDVANSFAPAFGTQMGGYGSYAAASRPITKQQGTPNWLLGAQAAGNVAGTLGSAAMMGCWVASACFGGWYKADTVWARFYVNFFAPKWFKNLYLKHGENIAKNKLAVKLLKPLFELFSKRGRKIAYGA